MMPDITATAVERTDAAQRLIEQAQDTELVDLVVLSALELCVLGGPKHPLFEEAAAQAWLKLRDRRRKQVITWATESMVKRGLLTENSSSTNGTPGDGTYSLSPALGIALAARCRPAFIVVTETAVASRRTPRLFALGDEVEPVRGVVVEDPTALPADIAKDFPYVEKFGPLGKLYRYVLVSPGQAAALLAAWAIAPPPQPPGEDAASGRLVSLYRRYDGRDPAAIRLLVWGDGTNARLDPAGAGEQPAIDHDLAGLRSVMLDLLTAPAP